MFSFLDDLRLAARSLKRNPGFALVAVTTLAAGIAACTVVFGIVNSVMFRPYDRYPDRFVYLLEQNRRLGTVGPVAPADLADWQRLSGSFERMAGIAPGTVALTGTGGEPESVMSGAVTIDLFTVLGGHAAAGRLFAAADHGPSPSAIVLSHGLWHRRFGGSPVVGKALAVDGRAATVIGVLDERFSVKPFVGGEPEVFIPMPGRPSADRSARSLLVVGWLKPGVTTARARAEISAIASSVGRVSTPSREVDVFLKNPREIDFEGDAGFLLALCVGMGFVLLIVCANVTNLLFARGAARTKEMATRLAIGARGWRIVRQALVEAVLLGLAGSIGAALLAYWACRALSWWLGSTNVGFLDLQPDARVFAFAVVVSTFASLAAAVAPAMRLARTPVLDGLKLTSSAAVRLSAGRLRRLLVAFEVGLAIVLLVGATLVLQGLVRLRSNDSGFRPDGVLAVNTTLSSGRYQRLDARIAFLDAVLERLASRHESSSVAAANFVPMAGAEVPVEPFAIEGRAATGRNSGDTAPAQAAGVLSVSSGYFSTLQIPLKRGRPFTDADRAGSLPVAIVSQAVVSRWFQGTDPIGTRIEVAGEWRTVVGVAGDVRNFHLNVAPAPTIYLPTTQRVGPQVALFVRARSGSPTTLAPAVKADIAAVDPQQPIRRIRSMPDIIEWSMGGFNLGTMVAGVLAAIALGLAALGIYGVVAYSVARRVRELGIRMALGATPGQVTNHVLREGLVVAAIGGVPGLLLALVAGRMLASALFRVRAVDPLILVSVSVVVVGMVLLASYVPARRAARIDPAVATSVA